jgi:hypothetical protein
MSAEKELGYFEKKPYMMDLLEKWSASMKLTDAQKLRVIASMEKSFHQPTEKSLIVNECELPQRVD